MAFDFRARANARREAAEAEQRRKDEAESALARQAESLRFQFEVFAKNDRGRRDLIAERSGAEILFSDGPKVLAIRVATLTGFDIRKSRNGSASSTRPETRRITGEEALVDYLDDWLAEN